MQTLSNKESGIYKNVYLKGSRRLSHSNAVILRIKDVE